MVKRRRRWPVRIAGLIGTAALLGSGVAIAVMVMPSSGSGTAVPTPAPAATPAPEAEEAPEPEFTKAQRQARRAAADEVTVAGYEVVTLADYDPKAKLRVLLGSDGANLKRAFFFAGRTFIGYDSDFASGRLKVVKSGKRSVTLRYGLADGGATRVRFEWDGDVLTPQSEIPAAELRAPAA